MPRRAITMSRQSSTLTDAGGHSMVLTRRRSSWLSDAGEELVQPPVQRSLVFSGSRASLASGHSQLGVLEEKGGESAELNLLSETEPDHRTGERAARHTACATLLRSGMPPLTGRRPAFYLCCCRDLHHCGGAHSDGCGWRGGLEPALLRFDAWLDWRAAFDRGLCYHSPLHRTPPR